MSSGGPVLIRGARPSRSVTRLGHVVTIACLAVAGLAVALRHPSPPAERMVLLRPPVQQVAQTQPAGPPPTPQRLGDWTPAAGERIARRALRWLSWPYSFGAGNADGPTYGHAVDADSRNDGHVVGFDCSGLTLYALAPWRALTHDAATQYHQVGSYHPALQQLQPGDLVFWSRDGTVNGIGHVAVYIGDGNVVQAPHSGARITVSPLFGVEHAYMGATRPLT